MLKPFGNSQKRCHCDQSVIILFTTFAVVIARSAIDSARRGNLPNLENPHPFDFAQGKLPRAAGIAFGDARQDEKV